MSVLSRTKMSISELGYQVRRMWDPLVFSRQPALAFKLQLRMCSQDLEPPGKMPVPTLQQTLDKYMKTVRPLVSDQEFKITAELVKNFGSPGGVGEKLQTLLENRANKTENWLRDWWLNYAYLGYRTPIVVHSNPGLIFPPAKFEGVNEQLRYAAQVIAASLDFKKIIDEKKFPLEKMGKRALDMSQYYKVLGTCRIPGEVLDSIEYHNRDTTNNPPEHIIVMHNNHIFKMHVYGRDGKPLTGEQILSQLEEVVKASQEPAQPVGVLTTEHRDNWGKAYNLLVKDPTNKSSLKDIHNSIFVICIDQPNPTTSGTMKMTTTALQMLHGNGSSVNSGNRWYDKTCQLIVGREGESGLTYEHTPAEGPPLAILCDYIVKYLEKHSLASSMPAKDIPPLKHLTFNISPDVQTYIDKATKSIDALVDDLEMSCFVYEGYGKEFIKSQKLSPDSFIQTAMQLAFYRTHAVPGATYESASLRQYIHGRTETIRSCTIEAVEFSKAMLNENATDQDRINLMRKAVGAHKNYVMDAMNGFGVDRHLLGLRLIAEENNIPVPPLYQDSGFLRSGHYRISSSQVACKCPAFMCFGPLAQDGYGICYNPRPNEMIFGVSASRSDGETAAEKMKEALAKSFTDMHDVLVRTPQSKL